MSKIKNGGLHQYGAEAFERQQFGTAGVERVKQPQPCNNIWRAIVVVEDVRLVAQLLFRFWRFYQYNAEENLLLSECHRHDVGPLLEQSVPRMSVYFAIKQQ